MTYTEWTHTCGGNLKVLLDSDGKRLIVKLMCTKCSWTDEPIAFSFREEPEPTTELIVTEEDLEAYLSLKGNLRPKTLNDYRFVLRHFLRTVDYTITKDSLLSYVQSISGLAKRRKRANVVKDFLSFLGEVYGVDMSPFVDVLDRVKPPKTSKKLFAEEDEGVYTLTLEDLYATEKLLIRMDRGGVKGTLRTLSCIVFLATTGMRPEEACWRTVKGARKLGVTKSMIDLSKDYFHLPAEISKTHTERIIPLHPDAKLVLRAYFRYADEDLWNYDTVRDAITLTPLKELRRLRKFFTRMSKKLGLDQIKRVAIQGHDEEELLKLKVTQQFYEKYTPTEIVQEYMRTWGRLKILDDEVRRWVSRFLR